MTRNKTEEKLVRDAVARLRAGVMAIVMATLGAAGLAFATVWLLLRGGPTVGQHLSLLGNYFPGYSVTWPGVLVGLFYGALVGAIVGWSTAWIYNLMVDIRHGART